MKNIKISFPYLFVLSLFLLSNIIFSCNYHPTSTQKKNDFDYLPTSTTKTIIYHKFYTLSYSEKHEQAEWVAYILNKDQITHVKLKRPYFIQDKQVKSGSADWKNYKKSGYTKGHLLPAGDRKFSKTAYNETFLTSNKEPH